MWRALPFALGYLLPLTVVAGWRLGGWWTFLTVPVVFAGVPILDALVGIDRSNAKGAEAAEVEAHLAFRAITWIWVPIQLALIVWAIAAATAAPAGPAAFLGLALSVGLTAGIVGITFAHELLHRASRVERTLAAVLMTSVCYPHFCIEHVAGHHRWVATPRDPATARLGESFYRFLPRTVFGGFASAWRIERARLASRGHGTVSPRNRMVRYAAGVAGAIALVAAASGPVGLLFFAAQSAVAVTMLEVINYIEHYGLTRRELAPGRFEPVRPGHSWDSSFRVTNWFLINLARHADHHCQAAKRYQVLDHLETAPQLPADYAAMFVAALVPPLWRRVMDPQVLAWRARVAGAHAPMEA